MNTLKSISLLVAVLIYSTLTFWQTNPKDFPVLKGPHLGQNSPGKTPEIFAPGIVSTTRAEHGSPVFSPDGNEIYWFSFPGPITQMIRLVEGQWTAPETVNFGGNPTI